MDLTLLASGHTSRPSTPYTRSLLAWSAEAVYCFLSLRPRRLHHSLAAAKRAARVVRALPQDQAVTLVAAANLHDIGYALPLALTELHQIDGARWVASRGLTSIAGLIAHHSEAAIELGVRGQGALLSEFEVPDRRLLDALTYCDMTTGPDGESVTLDERIEEVGRRRGRDSIVFAALTLARPRYELAIERTLMLMQGQEKVASGSPFK